MNIDNCSQLSESVELGAFGSATKTMSSMLALTKLESNQNLKSKLSNRFMKTNLDIKKSKENMLALK